MGMYSYAALLRGVSPSNAKMPALKRCFEHAGLGEVKTVLSSGNVVFTARRAQSEEVLVRKIEAAMAEALDRRFATIVRPIAALRGLLDRDPFQAFRLAAGAKRVVTFLREAPRGQVVLPSALDGAQILGLEGREVLSAYVPGPKGPMFMTMIEKAFGKDVTTRTWETVGKIVRAGEAGGAVPRRG
jgi:uncharacterized protein (DUF1697 family)